MQFGQFKIPYGAVRTGIAEVMGSNPVRAWIFFRSYLQLLVSVVFLAARIS